MKATRRGASIEPLKEEPFYTVHVHYLPGDLAIWTRVVNRGDKLLIVQSPAQVVNFTKGRIGSDRAYEMLKAAMRMEAEV
jgi:hypothetical protein